MTAKLLTCPVKASCSSCLIFDAGRQCCSVVSIRLLLELQASLNQDVANHSKDQRIQSHLNDFTEYPGGYQP